ncbi:hypothetical protein HPP92_005324 [Vanilla planifolia]|uniref:protein-serine/threonine phosphatase n=1 Tax=Vanilla planifolia TaxID=51239 RepID=A0A835RL60_VANPL|nr:hypothetical protein HPP92_005324 [Vanilla planifolia]
MKKHSIMVEQFEFVWTLISILFHLFHVLKKAVSMSLCSNPAAPPQSPLSWKLLAKSPAVGSKKSRNSLKTESLGLKELEEEEAPRRPKRRPAKIVIPPVGVGLGFGEGFNGKEEKSAMREMEVEGSVYSLASRTGTRHTMEDGYGVITDIHGDSKQALFGVFDGHGGRAAVDFVMEKLGKNIIRSVEEVNEKEEGSLKLAIKAAYLKTNQEFLSQGVRSGSCAATVLLKNGELHVSNVGDCRVVMSRKGVADALTTDHRPGREDERIRIENLGGFVNCRNGVWRVQDSLAISRAIGDIDMKEWVISEPDTKTFHLNQDCEFLIMASDGLWDKVGNQEAVDMVIKQRNWLQSCRDLVEMSCSRGNRDDITVMVVDLRSFSC